ncbi:MAG: sigma-70 family RNA polymerase sigma factor [Sphingobacteriaceae bacterium]|nr:sigma-70 family RNA polymerase sigma factor [Sphingobacteriaceae bacterium]
MRRLLLRKLRILETLYEDPHYNLVVECKKGNRKAQYELYNLFSKGMYNVALRIVNDEDEAADVLQDSFIHAFTRIVDFRHESTFGWWMKQIVVNKAISAYRKRKFDFIPLDEGGVEDIPDTEFTDQEEVNYQVQRVKDGIHLLPDNYRIVISLYLLEGYDHEEIGHILKITENTSRSQLLRAKRKLIAILKNQGMNINK